MRVILILADGMRPDSLENIEAAQRVIGRATRTMRAQTVMPSATLPCHMSLFHSVDPTRHGTATNTYAPQVRPINGLCEVLKRAGKTGAFFYDWEQLRDLTRPDTLSRSIYYRGGSLSWGDLGFEVADNMLTDAAIDHLTGDATDFTFLYMGFPDDVGHRDGWMGEQYLYAVENCWRNIERVLEVVSEDDVVIITADHGGHDRTHGSDRPEDMTIPLLLLGGSFGAGELAGEVSIKDIAPTVTALLGVQPDAEWEGKSLLN